MQQQQKELSTCHPQRDSRLAQAARVEAAASEAIALVEKYAELDPYDTTTTTTTDAANPWNRPDLIFAELREAREKIKQAWEPVVIGEGEQQQDETTTTTDSESSLHALDEARVRSMYVEMTTDAFADVLEEVRLKEGDALDVDILVDCLQSGMDLLSTTEIDLMVMEQEGRNGTGGGDVNSEELTPHEQRRRQMGFHVQVK